jgi:hypothetical protein
MARPAKALLAVACLTASADFGCAASSDGLSSKDLLKDGFELVAEGDLLTVREIGRYRLLDDGIFVLGPPIETCERNDMFVAEVPSRPRPRCGTIWWNDRYDEFVRLKRGNEEFVCVLGQSEDCYRSYSSAQ